MAVQKSKKSRSRRDMRRSHNAPVANHEWMEDASMGQARRRHHVLRVGKSLYYRGKEILLGRQEA